MQVTRACFDYLMKVFYGLSNYDMMVIVDVFVGSICLVLFCGVSTLQAFCTVADGLKPLTFQAQYLLVELWVASDLVCMFG